MSDGEVAELPAVDHAAGFERYKVSAACLQSCKLSCNPQEFAGTEACPWVRAAAACLRTQPGSALSLAVRRVWTRILMHTKQDSMPT